MTGRAYLDGRVTVHAGDCLDVIRTLPDNSVDSCVTDPPYHLTSIVKRFGGENAAPAQFGTNGAYARASTGFMGKQWDGGDIAFQPELWAEVLRVLKPGGHVLAFGGTRTYHRLACAIEDAGFEIRDQIGWAFGSGFPKSHDVSKGIDKALGASGTYGEPKSAAHAGWIDRGRMRGEDGHDGYQRPWMLDEEAVGNAAQARKWAGYAYGTALKPAWEPICMARKPLEGTVAANVLKHGTGAINVGACRVATNWANDPTARGWQGGNSANEGSVNFGAGGKDRVAQPNASGRWPANLIHDGSDEVVAAFPETTSGVLKAGTIRNHENQIYGKGMSAAGIPATLYDTGGDSGSAARFFYSAKADSNDRLGSKHPTVKPVDLMQYLVRLVTPRGGTVLDCFGGTGTTAEAAVREGMKCILVEREEAYLQDIERRMALVMAGPASRNHATVKAKGRPEEPLPLFAEGFPQ